MLFLRGGGVCVICMRKAVDPITCPIIIMRLARWLRDGRHLRDMPYNYTNTNLQINVSKTAPRLSQK